MDEWIIVGPVLNGCLLSIFSTSIFRNPMKNIAIIGSGVVGTATGKGFLTNGHKVIFYDIDESVLSGLRRQGLEAKHMDDLDVKTNDAFFLTVSTPTENGRINLMHLKSAVSSLGRRLKNREDYCVVIVRSTVPPRTTEDILIPILEKESKKRSGVDFGVAMNPEYLRERNAEDDFGHPWVITIGSIDRRSRLFMDEIFSDYDCEVHHLSLREAEMQKYIHNLYNALKIAFFNEMRMICDRVDISPEIIFDITTKSAEGFWNSRYGTGNKGPFGGMCLPKDTQAFLHWSEELDMHMDVLDGVIKSNEKFKKIWDKMQYRKSDRIRHATMEKTSV